MHASIVWTGLFRGIAHRCNEPPWLNIEQRRIPSLPEFAGVSIAVWSLDRYTTDLPLASDIYATAFDGVCDRGVYHIANSLLLSARLVSHNSPKHMTTEAS